MPPNRDCQDIIKGLGNYIKAGQIRQGWNWFVEHYRRQRFGANWEQHQISGREFVFVVIGISIGLVILACAFLFITLIESLNHSFSEHGPFKEICAVHSISKKLRR